MSTTALTPIERLKAGIWDIHEGVASNGQKMEAPSEDNIVKGTLPLYKYRHNLGQRYLLQKGFEKVLDAFRHMEPRIAHVVTDDQFHAWKSAEDMKFFGDDPATVQPVPATTEFLRWVAECGEKSPILILAIHYVIEGSNNGAVYIAKAVQKAYGLTGRDGVYHLLPYGEEIRTKWKAFTVAFNENQYSEKEMAEMIVAGRRAFGYMNKIAAESYALPENA